MKLKQLDAKNDYLAIYVSPISEDLYVDDKSQYNNEGVVVGKGPKVSDSDLDLGDKVIFLNKNYSTITPESGGYNGNTIVIIRESDILIKHRGSSEVHEVVHWDEWSEE